MVGLVVIGVVAGVSVVVGGEGGLQVASAAVGGIAGWLARSGKREGESAPSDRFTATSPASGGGEDDR